MKIFVSFFLTMFCSSGFSQENKPLNRDISIVKANIILKILDHIAQDFDNNDSIYTKAYIDIEYSDVRISDGPGGYYILSSPVKVDSAFLSIAADSLRQQISSGNLVIRGFTPSERVHRAYKIMGDISFLEDKAYSKLKVFVEISKPIGGWNDLYLAYSQRKQKDFSEIGKYISDILVFPVFVCYKSRSNEVHKQLLLFHFNFQEDQKGNISIKFIKTIKVE